MVKGRFSAIISRHYLHSLAMCLCFLLAACGGGGGSGSGNEPAPLPIASAGPDQSVLVGRVVQLDGRDSSTQVGDLSFSWSFVSLPSGSEAALMPADLNQTLFTADVAGDYIVQLVVSNGQNNSEPDQVTIHVSEPAPDSIAPTIPTDLTAVNVSTNSVEIEWTPSLDNQEVDGYFIYVDNVLVGFTNTTGFEVNRLSSNTRFVIEVSAVDEADNESERAPIEVTTDSILMAGESLVTLTVDEPAGIARSSQPLRMGVPFPQGMLQASESLTLAQGDNALPLQTKPLSLWDDGSVRWMLLDTQISVAAGQAIDLDVRRSAGAVPAASSLLVSESDTFIEVNTGPLQLVVPKTNGSVIHSASINSVAVIEPPVGDVTDRGPWVRIGETDFMGGLLESDSLVSINDPIRAYEDFVERNFTAPFNLHSLRDLSVTIEEQGPLHVVIRVSGTHLNDSGIGYSSFVTRVHAYQGQSQLKLDHTFIFTGDGNDRISGYGFRLPVTGEDTLIEGEAVALGSVTHLEYNSHTVNGEAKNAQAEGYIARSNGEAAVSVVLKEMAENYPKALTASATELDVQLYPLVAEPLNLARYSNQIDTANGETASIPTNRAAQGLAKTDTFYINFSAGEIDQSTVESMATVVDSGPLLALASADWYSDARVMGVGGFAFNADINNSDRHYRIDRKLHVIADFMRYNQREQFDWFGMVYYGDIRGRFNGGCAPGRSADCTWSTVGRYGWSGNSGDPSNQLWVQFLRRPTHQSFNDAVAFAKHTQDVQMIHFGDASSQGDQSISGGRNREFSVGSLHRHGRQPWSGYGQQPEYSHIGGVETYYYLTGDGRAKETLFEAAAFITRFSSNRPGDTALTNGIDTLSRAAAVFYDEPEHAQRFNNRLEVLVNYLSSTTPNPIEAAIADRSLNGSFNYFVRGSTGLLYHHERTGDDRVAELIFDAADIITEGGDRWGVGESGVTGSVLYYLNSLTYAATIAEEYERSREPYYNLVDAVMSFNEHTVDQPGASAISLNSYAAIPTDWRDWQWRWDESELDPNAPALLHIARQMTFRNDFLQDYHSYRGFIHLAAAAALIEAP